MNQHTPGPWRVDWLDAMNGWIMDGSGNYLADIVTKDEDGRFVDVDQQVANARLIAAAPELLAALRLLVAERDHAEHYIRLLEDAEFFDANGQPTPCTSPASTVARAAIAKAQGGAQ